MWTTWWLLLLFVKSSQPLLCYNCSSVHKDLNRCAGNFIPNDFHGFPTNNTLNYLTNCTGENAMCFVREWSTRAHHAWIVQRGCYSLTPEDPLPRYMRIPARSMICKHERHPDAEYKVCMCQSDWCNSASTNRHAILQHLTKWIYDLLYRLVNGYRLSLFTLY